MKVEITLKPIVKPPKLPGIFEEIIRFDAETNAMRTNVIHLKGYAARRELRRGLSWAAETFIARQKVQGPAVG